MDHSAVICSTSPFAFLWVSGLICRFYSISDVDPDQTPHDMASGLCLHCLPMTLLRMNKANILSKIRNFTVDCLLSFLEHQYL